MCAQVSRIQFLRGDFRGKETPLRPPWAIDESLFVEICTSCGDCIPQCPTHIIKKGRANYPVIDFTSGECLFCEECVNACKPRALLKTTHHTPWSVKATINQEVCISYKGVECRSCYDPCETRAVTMRHRPGSVSIPVISDNVCCGCGACFSVCPVSAITMYKPQYTQQ